MQDERINLFRKALTALVESLSATVRVNRWNEAEPVPEPLRTSAAALVERLGAADRLASSKFMGKPADVARVNAICESLHKLDVAYVAYRQKYGMSPEEREAAAEALVAEIDEVKSGESAWS